MIFWCIVCFLPSWCRKKEIGREATPCRFCKATARERALIFHVHREWLKRLIWKRELASIVGVSDGYRISKVLSRVYRRRYKNYHYHKAPYLDITNVPDELIGTADIVVCSEVLEHISPPVERGFQGLSQVTKLDGCLIFSVPHLDNRGVHREHFPVLERYDVKQVDGEWELTGVDQNGKESIFRDLVFHGGEGSTLEFRVFSQSSIESYLSAIGFTHCLMNRNNRFIGASWEPWSRVWICQREK